MNYILEKTNKQVVWINPDPNKLTGVEAWGEFNPSIHEIVHALNYNPQLGDTFLAMVIDGMAQDFTPTMVYDKTSGVARVLFNWDDVMDLETETEDEPLRDENEVLLPYQIYTESGWVLDFEKLKSLAIQNVEARCSWWICDGFQSAALGEPHFYNSDRDDQLNLIGLAALGTSELLKCTQDLVAKKEYTMHTTEQLKIVLIDGANRKKFLLHKAGDLKTKISNATTIGELNEIDIESGWEQDP
ncbi:hypothetical protein QMN07_15215 [Leptospira santarosai]|uniref:hypothetical protein n=1 Tax=Leptospira santarosai TaxID=28183 RepID=UPI0024AF9F85|nr:hypothetical protein [Leptospira santarosai]MDI7218849.1 hypothetical protein [Leptospira santarosai]